MPRALIIGDSFVRRLEKNRSGLNLRRWDVQYRGVPGADIGRLWTVLRQHGPRRYHTVVIHVGSNDLCRSNDADAVVQSILDLAMYVLDDDIALPGGSTLQHGTWLLRLHVIKFTSW